MTPHLIGNIRPRIYTAGSAFNARLDSTSSRIRAAFSGRLSSSNSSTSDDQESPSAEVFSPLEEVWEALEEWFLLLWNEMEEIEGKVSREDCTLMEDEMFASTDHIAISHVKASVKRHQSEITHGSERFSFPIKQEEVSDKQKKCSLSRSVSASGRLGEQLPRNVAAALVPYRAKSVRHKLLRFCSDATFRLSQPAIEMNLDRLADPVSPGWSSPSETRVFNLPSVNNVVSTRGRTGERITSSQLNSPSYNSDSSQTIVGNRSPTAGSPMAERGSHNNLDNTHCEPNVEPRTGVSQVFSSGENDVITMTADRLCVITHGFYLCCCHQSRWDRR